MKLCINKVDLSKCHRDDILITSNNTILIYKYNVEIDDNYVHVLYDNNARSTITLWNTKGVCLNDGYVGEENNMLGHIIQMIPKELYEIEYSKNKN